MAEATVIQFTVDLKQFSEQVVIEFATVVWRVLLDLLRRLSFRTPKDTGRAAGSWMISADTPTTEMLPEGDYGQYQSNESAAAAAEAVAQRLLSSVRSDPYHVWWVVNNVPYIEPLNNGHSQQAPAGFVELIVAEVEAEMLALMRTPSVGAGVLSVV